MNIFGFSLLYLRDQDRKSLCLSSMKRAAHVAGLMQISGNGTCIRELRRIAPSTMSEPNGAVSSNESR